MSSMSGHFIAYCRNAINDKWYCYNDSSVTLCKDKNYLNGVPYILFYQEIEVAWYILLLLIFILV